MVFGPLMMHPAQVVNKMFMMNRMTGTDTRIPRVPPLRTPRILTPLIAANEREIVPTTRNTSCETVSQMVGTVICANVLMKSKYSLAKSD